MNTLTTYSYEGGAFDFTGFGNISVFWTLYAEVAIYYGPYIGASVVPSVQPLNLPPLQNVEFNAQFYRCTAGGVPTTKYSAADLIVRHDLFDPVDSRICYGTKFTFSSPIILESCANYYCLVWSTGSVQMPYGPDMIHIAAQNGVSPALQPC